MGPKMITTGVLFRNDDKPPTITRQSARSSFGLPRDARNLPWTEFCEDAAGQRLALAAEARDLFVDVDLGVVSDVAKLVDFRLELGDRLLKVEKFDVHRS